VEVLCLPADSPFAPLLFEPAAAVAQRLMLDRYLVRLVLCLDDLVQDERIWISFAELPREPGAADRPHRQVTLYLHPGHLLKDRPPTSLLPGTEIWEMRGPRLAHREGDPRAELSRANLERFLYHQLMSVRDLCDGTIDPAAVPADTADAFQEAWAVTVDGRLRRQRWPGFTAAERRRRFSRIFGRGGVLLPEHWRIFHELWELDPVEQVRLLEWLRKLPRLRR
jgi:hypothetical protein